jgi:phosphoglycerate kinase
MKKKARIIVITHLGRPEGRVVDSLKLDAVATRLSKLLGKKAEKLHNCVGKSVEAEVKKMEDGDIFLLENIRFHPEEEACEAHFTKELAELGDIFVNDAFAACHRKHSSTAGIARYLPAYAGLLVEKEMKNLTPLLKKFSKPLTLIVGGAKVDTKIGLLKNYFGKAKYILIGGALANTFLAAEGHDIGKSLYEPEKLDVARNLLLKAEKAGQKILIPEDVVVADVVTQYAKTICLPIEDVEGNMKILDIGPKTRAKYIEIIKKSKTVIMNGPMGLYEFTPFASGTKSILNIMTKVKAKTYLGGGDTIDSIKRCNIPAKKFTFVSTGGGAMLEFLEGKKLPGIEVLKK